MAELRKLFPYVRPYLWLLAGSLLLLTGTGFFEMSIVALLEPTFNLLKGSDGTLGQESLTSEKFPFLTHWISSISEISLIQIGIFIVILSFLKGTFLYVADYAMAHVGQKVVGKLRRNIQEALISQSSSFFSVNPTGHLMARVISDTERLQNAVSVEFTDFFRQVILLLVFLGMVFYIDWWLSLLAFLVAPLVLLITWYLGRRVRRLAARVQEKLADVSSSLQETISGQEIVKAFNTEEYERQRFSAEVDNLVDLNLKTTRLTAMSSPLMEFIGYALFAPFLFYADQQISQGGSLGSFVVFMVALFRLYEPIRKLSRMHLHFQKALASASRIFHTIETPVEIKDSGQARPLHTFCNRIRFENVRFAYQSDQNPVLDGIDLEIRRGEVVALVGPSGAGKSTLISLIPRFYDVLGGRITIDGKDIREVTLDSLRTQIAMVTQETFLFNDTVRNNIAYGRFESSLEEVQEAAKAAYIHDFIETLPRGYDSVIGERGDMVSGGQRQRIAIARAILKGAPILILDEATSALDSESEHLVQMALYNLMEGRTTVVIAHRFSTIRRADRIVVMESGRIAEIGNHDSLVAASGKYRKYYEMQVGAVGAG